MSENLQYFHFTLGPVQSFVAQARRTRDFWAGSFLLSWLSAVAMVAVKKQGGEIIFPKVSDEYLVWLEKKGLGDPPQQGCIPNRFKGGLAKVPGNFDPQLVADSIQDAWKALADKVWLQDLADLDKGSETGKIWDRQVRHFWEISWALTDNVEESNILDRRKNWRSYLPPDEAGVKCMMMDGWQELSGVNSPNSDKLGEFWSGVIQKGGTAIKTDFRVQENDKDDAADNKDKHKYEYLCAIAFIKRRFVHCFKGLKSEMPGGWYLQGWAVNSSVPSVAYMAAAPWLAQVLEHAPEQELQIFHDKAKKLTGRYPEYSTRLSCFENIRQTKLQRDSQNLDGNVFFDAALGNKNIFPNQNLAKEVKDALGKLYKSVTALNIAPVSPFYAVLMMDGDSLGKHMSDVNNQENISKGLEEFTNGVQTIVEQHSGFLIYAGGDDVLALLPLEYALNCAKALRNHYLRCFADYPRINTTLSGAIEYAHINMPLGKVLGDAHQLLDHVAKDYSGRDSIAVRVWKPGGRHLQWAMPWEKAIVDDKVAINELANAFQKAQQETPFSSSFFFNVEERLVLLAENAEHDQKFPFDPSVMTQLIAAEYLNSGVNRHSDQPKVSLQAAMDLLKPLVDQCFEKRRTKAGGIYQTYKLNADALQLIRFLAEKGVEHG
ncbi:MAG: type III-B CRISPR-associated protein Cas10/Cmr2 [Methylobacter sp.]|nr:type III-B CRISPR-associated protein Cas10/Cmr2 [Methylobacter sp.]